MMPNMIEKLDKIKLSEEEANMVLNKAKKEAKAIIANAEENASKILSKAIEQSEKYAKAEIETYTNQSEVEFKKSKEEIYSKNIIIGKKAEKNLPQSVDYIIKGCIE